LALLTAKERKWGVMVRKGFITPQNKQHEKTVSFLRSLVLYFNIFFSSQKLKAQN
jgi:hypothetical protein